MLRVNKNVDIKELEKHGFTHAHYGYVYYPSNNSPKTRYFSRMIVSYNGHVEFTLVNMNMWCNSLVNLESDMINIQESYEAFKVKTQELIEAGVLIDE